MRSDGKLRTPEDEQFGRRRGLKTFHQVFGLAVSRDKVAIFFEHDRATPQQDRPQ